MTPDEAVEWIGVAALAGLVAFFAGTMTLTLLYMLKELRR